MKLKNLFFSATALLVFSSCTVTDIAKYYPDNTLITDLNTKEGKWLLGNITISYKYHDELYGKIQSDFKSLLGNRLTEAAFSHGILVPANFPLNPSNQEMKDLYTGTGYDYFINIKALQISQDFGQIDLTNHHNKDDRKNMSRVTLEIYDLKNNTIIYSQNVTGIDQVAADDNSDFHTHQDSGSIMIGCYKEAFKELKKNVIL
jgi:hypothetical protein